MNESLNHYIENFYNENMWVTEKQKNIIKKISEEKSWSKEDLEEFINSEKGPAIKRFLKVFDRKKNKEVYYKLRSIIYKVGEEAVISIECKFNFQRLAGDFKVYILPYYDYQYGSFKEYVPYSTIIHAEDNAINISYKFKTEDMYIINVFYEVDNEEHLLLSTNVYALNEDLFDFGFYKADFHLHTTYSDGFEPPELVMASVREFGMDIVAVTDHNCFEGSLVAREKAKEMQLDLTVINGEEYSLDFSPMHIVSLGTEKELDRKFLKKRPLEPKEIERIIGGRELSCDMYAYVYTQILLEEVKKMHGVSILAHPLWKPIGTNGIRIDTPESLFMELSKDKKFDGIEVVSGSPNNEFYISNLQYNLAKEAIKDITEIPITGITDSHYYTTDPISGRHYTIVFSKSNVEGDILEAIREGRCVAVELINDKPICYGHYRLVKIAYFLINYYFPERDVKAYKEGIEAKENYLLKKWQ